jgi:starch phosphorylase
MERLMYCKNVMMRASHIAYGRYGKTLAQCNARELNNALSLSLMDEISEAWKKCDMRKKDHKRAYYFSAEYLIGRVVQNNILCLENGKELIDLLDEAGVDLGKLEDVEDAALGNGGLGRLAACLLDSAATLGIPLDGYGIRYRYGLFKQTIKDGFQKESADDWSKFGDPWSIRRDSDTVRVDFADESVLAVPYDMPVIGFHSGYIGTLRLWQSEPIEPFDFERFNDGEYDKSVAAKNRAEDLSRVLYPNDHTPEGRLLRLKQQYFFSSASIRDIVKNYLLLYGDDFSRFGGLIACQLNDTHPVVAIPELIRVIMDEHGINFDTAFRITQSVFSYTNHTVMQEALEKWPREQMEIGRASCRERVCQYV